MTTAVTSRTVRKGRRAGAPRASGGGDASPATGISEILEQDGGEGEATTTRAAGARTPGRAFSARPACAGPQDRAWRPAMAFLFCHLYEIMEKRNLRIEDVSRICGVHRSFVSNLRQNTFRKLVAGGVVKLCKGLDLTMSELFSIYDADPWFPVRLHRKLTVHLGCNTFAPSERSTEAGSFGRYYIGGWDVWSYAELRGYLDEFDGKVRIRYRGHDFGTDTDRRTIDEVFKSGDHLVIGSPISNRFTEFVICRMYDVPPFTPEMRTKFPLQFVWDSDRRTASSFGYQGQEDEFGILSTQTGKLVARRTFVAQGEGEDCALIVVQRLFQPPKLREHYGHNDQRVIICILGHSGPGTLAALRVARDPRYAPFLWPAERGTPLMAAVAARYTREPGSNGRDNRVLTHCELVDPETGEGLAARIEKDALDAQRNRPVPPSRQKTRTRDRQTPPEDDQERPDQA